MSKRPQRVLYKLVANDGEMLAGGEVDGTNTGNIQSRIQVLMRDLTIAYNMEGGVVLTITMEPAQPDEFVNPDR